MPRNFFQDTIPTDLQDLSGRDLTARGFIVNKYTAAGALPGGASKIVADSAEDFVNDLNAQQAGSATMDETNRVIRITNEGRNLPEGEWFLINWQIEIGTNPDTGSGTAGSLQIDPNSPNNVNRNLSFYNCNIICNLLPDDSQFDFKIGFGHATASTRADTQFGATPDVSRSINFYGCVLVILPQTYTFQTWWRPSDFIDSECIVHGEENDAAMNSSNGGRFLRSTLVKYGGNPSRINAYGRMEFEDALLFSTIFNVGNTGSNQPGTLYLDNPQFPTEGQSTFLAINQSSESIAQNNAPDALSGPAFLLGGPNIGDSVSDVWGTRDGNAVRGGSVISDHFNRCQSGVYQFYGFGKRYFRNLLQTQGAQGINVRVENSVNPDTFEAAGATWGVRAHSENDDFTTGTAVIYAKTNANGVLASHQYDLSGVRVNGFLNLFQWGVNSEQGNTRFATSLDADSTPEGVVIALVKRAYIVDSGTGIDRLDEPTVHVSVRSFSWNSFEERRMITIPAFTEQIPLEEDRTTPLTLIGTEIKASNVDSAGEPNFGTATEARSLNDVRDMYRAAWADFLFDLPSDGNDVAGAVISLNASNASSAALYTVGSGTRIDVRCSEIDSSADDLQTTYSTFDNINMGHLDFSNHSVTCTNFTTFGNLENVTIEATTSIVSSVNAGTYRNSTFRGNLSVVNAGSSFEECTFDGGTDTDKNEIRLASGISYNGLTFVNNPISVISFNLDLSSDNFTGNLTIESNNPSTQRTVRITEAQEAQVTAGTGVTLQRVPRTSTIRFNGSDFTNGMRYYVASKTTETASYTEHTPLTSTTSAGDVEVTIEGQIIFKCIMRPLDASYETAFVVLDFRTENFTQGQVHQVTARKFATPLLSSSLGSAENLPAGTSILVTNGMVDGVNQAIGSISGAEGGLSGPQTQNLLRQVYLDADYVQTLIDHIGDITQDFIRPDSSTSTIANGDYLELGSTGAQQTLTAVTNESPTPVTGKLSALISGTDASNAPISFNAVVFLSNPAGISLAEVETAMQQVLNTNHLNQVFGLLEGFEHIIGVPDRYITTFTATPATVGEISSSAPRRVDVTVGVNATGEVLTISEIEVFGQSFRNEANDNNGYDIAADRTSLTIALDLSAEQYTAVTDNHFDGEALSIVLRYQDSSNHDITLRLGEDIPTRTSENFAELLKRIEQLVIHIDQDGARLTEAQQRVLGDLRRMIANSGLTNTQFTTVALENAPTGSGSGGTGLTTSQSNLLTDLSRMVENTGTTNARFSSSALQNGPGDDPFPAPARYLSNIILSAGAQTFQDIIDARDAVTGVSSILFDMIFIGDQTVDLQFSQILLNDIVISSGYSHTSNFATSTFNFTISSTAFDNLNAELDGSDPLVLTMVPMYSNPLLNQPVISSNPALVMDNDYLKSLLYDLALDHRPLSDPATRDLIADVLRTRDITHQQLTRVTSFTANINRQEDFPLNSPRDIEYTIEIGGDVMTKPITLLNVYFAESLIFNANRFLNADDTAVVTPLQPTTSPFTFKLRFTLDERAMLGQAHGLTGLFDPILHYLDGSGNPDTLQLRRTRTVPENITVANYFHRLYQQAIQDTQQINQNIRHYSAGGDLTAQIEAITGLLVVDPDDADKMIFSESALQNAPMADITALTDLLEDIPSGGGAKRFISAALSQAPIADVSTISSTVNSILANHNDTLYYRGLNGTDHVTIATAATAFFEVTVNSDNEVVRVVHAQEADGTRVRLSDTANISKLVTTIGAFPA